MIEASPDMARESEKEWYFGNAEKERLGPYSFEEVKIYYNDNIASIKWLFWDISYQH